MDTVAPARSGSRLGLLLIVITALLWGTIGIAARGVYDISPANAQTVGFFRVVFAVPALWLTWRMMLGSFTLRLDRTGALLLGLLGLALACYQITYFAAVAALGVTIAVLVALCTAPVLVALLAALVLGERLTWYVIIALLLALTGTALLVLAPRGAIAAGSMPPVTLPGIALALGAGLSYAIVTLCSRSLAGRYHPIQASAIGFTLAAMLLLPMALHAGLVVRYSLYGWALLVYLGLVPTALGYILFFWGLRTTTATVASITTLLEPLTGAVLAWLLLGERLEASGWLGAALLLAALALLSWQNMRAPPETIIPPGQ